MPPLPSVPGVLKITHHFTVGEDLHALVRWHMTYTGGAPSNATCAALASAIAVHFGTDCDGAFNAATTFTGVDVLDLSSPTGGEGTATASVAGTRVGDVLGAGTAALVSMPIARRYRGGKPRSYWPFGTALDLLNANTWQSSAVTSWIGDLETYLGHLEGLTSGTTVLATLVSVSYYEGFTSVLNPITGRTKDVPKVRTGAIPVDPIESLVGSVKLASQRRRNAQKR